MWMIVACVAIGIIVVAAIWFCGYTIGSASGYESGHWQGLHDHEKFFTKELEKRWRAEHEGSTR